MRTLYFLLVLSMVGCSAQPSSKGHQQAVVREIPSVIRGRPSANGTPTWSAVLVRDRLLLDSPISPGWYSAEMPLPRAEIGRIIYTADGMTLVAQPAACTISEYRDSLPNHVTLYWRSGRWEGCSGRGRLPGSVAGTTWELVRLGGNPAPAGQSPPATLTFGTDGSLRGTLACNDGAIRTTWSGSGGFVAHGGEFESTKMACNDPAVEDFGRRFWSGLTTARTWRHDVDRVFITFANGIEAEIHFLM